MSLFAVAALLWRRAWAHETHARGLASAQIAAAPPHNPNPDEPLLLTQPVGADQGRTRIAVAALAAIAPALALFVGEGAPGAYLWFAALVAAAGIVAAERLAWRPAAWFAAGAIAFWGIVAIHLSTPATPSFWPAFFIAALGLIGLAHMRREPLDGVTLAAVTCGIAGAAIVKLGAATPYGAALAIIVAAAAIAGAINRKLEPALVLAWFVACLGLYILSGQESAEIWLTPACVLVAALFLSVEAITLPRRGRDALIPAATGAIAAPLAVYILYGANFAPGRELMEAGAWLGVAIVQAAILWRAALRPGGLHRLGFAIIPPIAALAASIIASASIALLLLWATAPLAACAVACAFVDARARHPAWKFLALVFMAAAIVNAVRVALLLYGGAMNGEALVFIFAGAAAPAILLGLAARAFADRAPWTSAALEAGALALGLAALIAFIRWLMNAGAPGAGALTFAEAGLHAAAWLTVAAMLLWREYKGAHDVRRAAALALIAAATTALFLGPFGALNPWWGAYPAPAPGAGIFNALLPGFAAAAPAFAALTWIALRRGWERMRVGFFTLAALCAGLWLALEIRRGFHGPDIAAVGVFGAETFALSLAALLAAAALRASRILIDAAERAAAFALALAMVCKLAFVDWPQPGGDWRAASLVVLALAATVLAAPRNDPGVRALRW